MPNFTVEDFVRECGSRFQFPVELVEKAISIAKEVEKSEIFSARSPKTVACAILYHVGKQNGYEITQPIVEEKCGITESALRKNTKIIRIFLENKDASFFDYL
ncbi:cyclin family protein [Sulfuracidifex metallicus]|uniref:cyclin family protein n=1 Tax=Sulfuracidifex metallicus TaxID=47303 RepID=UPI003C6F4855